MKQAWPLWLVTLACVGAQWDIAWHRSIGRDTFWTPPHISIYLSGVFAGIACAYSILSATFAGAKDSTVGMWGFRGPLGAFVGSWGGLAMLASAPFDDWWHGAYGLDVKILSLPHVILMLGIAGVQLGALILVLSRMNRTTGSDRAVLAWLFIYLLGMVLATQSTAIMERTARVQMHGAPFYFASACVFPLVLAGIVRATRMRWAATAAAGVYTVFFLALLWILPLVHAEPKLGPVRNPVTTLIPAGFPLLLLVPALALDVLWQRAESWRPWRLAAACGAVFFTTLLAAQWPFAEFLNSPAAHNAFFGSGYLDYRLGPDSFSARNLFRPDEGSFARGLVLTLLMAILTSRLGLAMSAWLQRLKR